MATATSHDIVVLDTNVVSQLWRRSDDELIKFYDDELRGARLLISHMTAKELWSGMLNSGWSPTRLEEWLMNLETYGVVHSTHELVIATAELQQLCRNQPPSEADLWIAATAHLLDCPLATEDQNLVNQVSDKLQVISTHTAQ